MKRRIEIIGCKKYFLFREIREDGDGNNSGSNVIVKRQILNILCKIKLILNVNNKKSDFF